MEKLRPSQERAFDQKKEERYDQGSRPRLPILAGSQKAWLAVTTLYCLTRKRDVISVCAQSLLCVDQLKIAGGE